jgi:hypothetical protein
MAKESKEQSFGLCIENKECEDLEKHKIYKVLPDDEASKEGYLRIVDKSGEDYLYPESYIARKRQSEITKSFGAISFDENFNYEKARKR